MQQSTIHIDINRTIIRDGFTQRMFDCLATESFVITSPKQVVHDFFITEGPLAEVAVFKNPSHLHELIDYYLIHEDERKAMASRGYRKVLAPHTYDHRVTEIFQVVSQEASLGSLNL